MSQTHRDDEDTITPVAITNYRDIRKLFGIKQKNRRGHMYIVGKTGTGKSTLISNMVASDIWGHLGVALIDPHGDLAEAVLDLVPKGRTDDVIYFYPADLKYPIAFNPLEKVHPNFHHLVASGLISVFRKIWPDFWGPRLEHILRHSLLTLLEYPGSTLLDLPRLLINREFRRSVVERLVSQPLREFWDFEFEKYTAWIRSEAVAPILNKVSQFLVCGPLRNIVGQKENRVDMRQVMDEGKILIVNLAKGKIGEDACSLLGAMLVTKMQLAALSRSDRPESQRRGFYLYVDEVHNFLTLSLGDVLSEARKYGLNLILAHQYMDQLEEETRSAVFGNIGTLISFRVGAEDAKYLAREFYPVFSEADFINLPNHHIYLKLMIDGVSSPGFSAVTLPPMKKEVSFREEIIWRSRSQYAGSPEVTQDQVFIREGSEPVKKPKQPSLFSK